MKLFDRFSAAAARWTGQPVSFIAACVVVIGWAAVGPLFDWSDTWQLVANTGTTIITFLMVFVVQASQNRNDCATHAKLDELIRAVDGARNTLIGIERASENQIEAERPQPGER